MKDLKHHSWGAVFLSLVLISAMIPAPVFAQKPAEKKESETSPVPSTPSPEKSENPVQPREVSSKQETVSQKSDSSKPETGAKASQPDAAKSNAAEPSAKAKSDQDAAPKRPNQIVEIEIRGNKIISTNTILSKIQSRKGNPLLQETVNGDIKRLYAAGFFEDIKMEVEEKENGYSLIISVIEKPVIRRIVIKGNKVIDEQKIRKEMKLIEGQILDRQAIKQGIEGVRKLYGDKGYRFVDIQSDLDINHEAKEAVVTLTVTEGEAYRIKSIDFEGAKAFPAKKLRKLMKTKKKGWWFFQKGIFNEQKFQKDLETIQFFYQQEGYLDVKVSPKFSYDKPKQRMMVTIVLDEGKHYVTGEIKIEGNRLFPESEIWQKLEMLPGLTYSQYYLSKDIEAIREFYEERGYMDARVIPDVNLNRDNGKVDVSYQIEEGDLYFVEKVMIRGNTKTKDIVIRRELRIRPGERFDGEKIKKSKKRLEDLNYFEEITYDTEPTPTQNRKDLIFRVKEKRTGELSFGGGVSSIDTLMGFAEISQRNFDLFNWPRFTGAGQSVSLSGRIGTISQNFNFNFTEPYLFNKPVGLSIDLYDAMHDNTNLDFSETRLGAGATLSRTFKDIYRVGGGYAMEHVKLEDIPSNAPKDVSNYSGGHWLSRLKAFTSRDGRDSIINPTKGNLITFNAELVGSFLGGDYTFYTLQASYTHYWTLFKKHLIEFKVRGGASQAFSDTDEVPVFDRFFAGGLGTVRGFNYRRVGPIENGNATGGQTMAIANLEYSYPLPFLDAFKGAFFVDAGQVQHSDYSIDFGKFAVSVGPGIKIKTPIGPVAFYYGLPIANRDTKNRNGRFEFSLSRGF